MCSQINILYETEVGTTFNIKYVRSISDGTNIQIRRTIIDNSTLFHFINQVIILHFHVISYILGSIGLIGTNLR